MNKTIKKANVAVSLLTILALVVPLTLGNSIGMALAVVEDIAVQGTITEPDGTTPVRDAWVEVRTEDYSFHSGSNTDELGKYAITDVPNGTYMLEVHPPWDAQGLVAPDPINLTYSGTTLTKNRSFIAATKTISGTVKYENGNPVAVGEIHANKMGGGSNVNAQLGESGTFQMLVSGGDWELHLGAGWNHETQQDNVVDWTYTGPNQAVSFATNSTTETKTVAFEVEKTDATVIGKLVMPGGIPVNGGHVELRTGDGPGYGTGVYGGSGEFSIPCKAGTYKLAVHLDTWNDPTLSQYYFNEISVTVAVDQTKNLGTITASQKTSSISGQVTDNNGDAVADLRVNTWKRNGEGWGDATTDADGKFKLWVFAGEWELMPEQGHQSDYIYSGFPVMFSVTDNQHKTGANFEVQLADAHLNITLVDSSTNEGISDMWGYAYARQEGMMHGPGGEFGSGLDRGTASIPLLGGTTYVVGLHMPPEESIYSLLAEQTVTIAVGQTKNVSLKLKANDSMVKGWVKDQDGNIVTNVEGEAYLMDENWQWKGTRIKEDGSFQISVLGGNRYMAGVHIWRQPGQPTLYIEKHPEPGQDFLVPEESEVTRILEVMKANRQIQGTVLDPDGNPIPWAWVWANNHRALEDKITGDFKGGKMIDSGTDTNANGQFSVPFIASKDIEVMAGLPPELSYMSPEMKIVDTTAGDVTGIVLQFSQPDAWIEATASLEDGTVPMFGFCWAWMEEGGFSGHELMNGKSTIPLKAGTWHVGCDTHMHDQGFYRSEEEIITVTTGQTKSASFIMKEGQFEIPEGGSIVFDSANQKVVTLPDGTVINIPAGALAESGNVTIQYEPDINIFKTADTFPLSFAWNFEAMDSSNQPITSFNSNVTITIPYDDQYLEDNEINENDIIAKYWDATSGAWKLPDGVSQDMTNNTVSFMVNHFTNFALATGSAYGAATVGSTGPADILATPASGGGPQIIIADENGNVVTNFFAYDSNLRIGLTASTGDIDGDGETEIVVAPGAGAGPQVRIFDHNGNVENQFFAYPEHIRSGMYVTTGDVTGDGTPDIVTSTREGAGPQVRVFDAEGNVVSQFMAYADTYRNGFRVTLGDINGDGIDEIIVVPDQNSGPQIRVFDYQGNVLASFFAYSETVRGGYNATTGDVDGDGIADILITPKAGLGPQVAMFTGNGTLINRFFAYAETFRGGINVSVGDTDGDGNNDIVACPESGAGPQIRVFDTNGSAKSQFWAYASHLRGKFTSFVADLNNDGTNEIVTAPGEGMGPQVRTFDKDGGALSQFFTHHTGFRGGLNMFPAY